MADEFWEDADGFWLETDDGEFFECDDCPCDEPPFGDCVHCDTDTTMDEWSVDATGITNGGCGLCVSGLALLHILPQREFRIGPICDWGKALSVSCATDTYDDVVVTIRKIVFTWYLRVSFFDGVTELVRYEKTFTGTAPDCSISHTLTKTIDTSSDCNFPATMDAAGA